MPGTAEVRTYLKVPGARYQNLYVPRYRTLGQPTSARGQLVGLSGASVGGLITALPHAGWPQADPTRDSFLNPKSNEENQVVSSGRWLVVARAHFIIFDRAPRIRLPNHFAYRLFSSTSTPPFEYIALFQARKPESLKHRWPWLCRNSTAQPRRKHATISMLYRPSPRLPIQSLGTNLPGVSNLFCMQLIATAASTATDAIDHFPRSIGFLTNRMCCTGAVGTSVLPFPRQ